VQSGAAPEPWGIVVLEEHEPAPKGGVRRFPPDGAAELLALLDSALTRLRGAVLPGAQQLARFSALSPDPAAEDVTARLTAAFGPGVAAIQTQLAELTALRDEVTAAVEAYQARAGRAAG
jgi:hypothetical protein